MTTSNPLHNPMRDPIEDGIRATYEGRMQDIDATAVFEVLVVETLPVFDAVLPLLPTAALEPLRLLSIAQSAGAPIDKILLRNFLVAISNDRARLFEIVALLPDRANAALALLFGHLADIDSASFGDLRSQIARRMAGAIPAPPALESEPHRAHRSSLGPPDFAMRFLTLANCASFRFGARGLYTFLAVSVASSALVYAFAPFVWLPAVVSGMLYVTAALLIEIVTDRDHERGQRPCEACRRETRCEVCRRGQTPPSCKKPDGRWVSFRGCALLLGVPLVWPAVVLARLLPETTVNQIFIASLQGGPGAKPKSSP